MQDQWRVMWKKNVLPKTELELNFQQNGPKHTDFLSGFL